MFNKFTVDLHEASKNRAQVQSRLVNSKSLGLALHASTALKLLGVKDAPTFTVALGTVVSVEFFPHRCTLPGSVWTAL